MEITVTDLLDTFLHIGEVMRFCARKTGIHDKMLASLTKIERAYLSRIYNGHAQPSFEQLKEFMLICGDDLPLQWLAIYFGYEIRPLQIRLEDQLRKERHEKEELKNKMDSLLAMLREAGIKAKI